MKRINVIILLFLILCSIESKAQQLAFPSAYGAGAYTGGGRGQDVYHVTNLNVEGTGSLKDALSQSNRVIVFDVSGVIDLSVNDSNGTDLEVSNISNVTIAGQTAPEGGITIDGGRVVFVNSNNIIIRYLRFKGGIDRDLQKDNDKKNNDDFDSLDFHKNTQNVILDHCSMAFGGDEAGSLYSSDSETDRYTVENITIQRCLFAETLKTGTLIGGQFDDVNVGAISVHHNIWYNISHRFPNIAGGNTSKFEIINNVVWTLINRLTRGNGSFELNHIGNYYNYGTTRLQYNRLNMFSWEQGAEPKIYTNGNKMIFQTTNLSSEDVANINNDNTISWRFFQTIDTEGIIKAAKLPSEYFVTSQFELQGNPIEIQVSEAAFNSVKNDVGCNVRLNGNGAISGNKDVSDAEWLSKVEAGVFTAGLSADNYIVEPIESKSRPEGYDTDNDGMPDEWERNTFGDLSRDGKNDINSDGYTDLEDFLNLVDTNNPFSGRTNANNRKFLLPHH